MVEDRTFEIFTKGKKIQYFINKLIDRIDRSLSKFIGIYYLYNLNFFNILVHFIFCYIGNFFHLNFKFVDLG